MKRHAALVGLSADHHHALVLARTITRAGAPASMIPEVRARFEHDLAPHFALEEAVLLPALAEAGASDLVARTLREHRELRSLVAAASRGDAPALAAFARLLHDHVRFEERHLFPACERTLAPATLEAVTRRFAIVPGGSER